MTISEVLARVGLEINPFIKVPYTPNQILVVANDAYRTIALLSESLIQVVDVTPTGSSYSFTLTDPTKGEYIRVKTATQSGRPLAYVPQYLLIETGVMPVYPSYTYYFTSTSRKVSLAGVTPNVAVKLGLEWAPKGMVLVNDSDQTEFSNEVDNAFINYLMFLLAVKGEWENPAHLQSQLNSYMAELSKFSWMPIKENAAQTK